MLTVVANLAHSLLLHLLVCSELKKTARFSCKLDILKSATTNRIVKEAITLLNLQSRTMLTTKLLKLFSEIFAHLSP